MQGTTVTRCEKKKYERKLDAKIALALIQKATASEKRGEKRVYLCPRCRAYHLTSLT